MRIALHTDSHAFQAPNTGPEIARVLRRMADEIEHVGCLQPEDGGLLVDSNGNTAGLWTMTAAPADMVLP